MNREDVLRKLSSRKFWLALAALLGSLAMGLSGVVTPEVCALCAALSAGIYSACEAYVDGASAKSVQTQTVITATSTDKATVAKAINGEPKDEG